MSVPIGQDAQNTPHMVQTDQQMQEIRPTPTESGDMTNCQTPPAAAMETTVTNTHVTPEQVAPPIHQQTTTASTECNPSAAEASVWQTKQPTHTVATEMSSADKGEQDHPSQATDVTAQNPTDKQTQTQIDQTDAAVQTNSPGQT